MSEHDWTEGAFDDVTPESFEIKGERETFDEFVDRHIKTLRVANLAANGQIHTGCILASRGGEWPIKDQDGEIMNGFMARLQKAARQRGADRMFFWRRSEVAHVRHETLEEAINANTPENWKANEDRFVEAIFFYAEERNAGETHARNGMLVPDQTHNLGEAIEGNPRQSFPLFAQVLD